jgi:hypothetical protein
VTGPAAPPVPEELDRLVRRMRLPYLRKAAPDVLATARAQRWDPAEVVRVLLAEEVTGRDAATRRLRRKTAGFPSGKTFASWRPEESSIPEPAQNALITLEWIGRAENLVAAGPSGTSKSHFVEALAHAAIEKDLRVAWYTLETLTAAISRAKADGSVARTVARICRCDLIVVDLCRPRDYAESRFGGRGWCGVALLGLLPAHVFGDRRLRGGDLLGGAAGDVGRSVELESGQQIGQRLFLCWMRDRHGVQIGAHQPVEQHDRVGTPEIQLHDRQVRVHGVHSAGSRPNQRCGLERKVTAEYLGIVTGCRGTPASCRWGGSVLAWR